MPHEKAIMLKIYAMQSNVSAFDQTSVSLLKRAGRYLKERKREGRAWEGLFLSIFDPI